MKVDYIRKPRKKKERKLSVPASLAAFGVFLSSHFRRLANFIASAAARISLTCMLLPAAACTSFECPALAAFLALFVRPCGSRSGVVILFRHKSSKSYENDRQTLSAGQ
jgi:hypothetical protein